MLVRWTESNAVCLCRHLKTTSANIKLITKFRSKEYDVSKVEEERMFAFWMEFFISATEEGYSSTRYPVGGPQFEGRHRISLCSRDCLLVCVFVCGRCCCLNPARTKWTSLYTFRVMWPITLWRRGNTGNR